jgi:hypothetical protein
LPRIESRRIIQIGSSSKVNNYFHFKAARACAITSSNGMPTTAPLSISATRLSTSTAQADSISLSSSRLAMMCLANSARSAGTSLIPQPPEFQIVLTLHTLQTISLNCSASKVF